jgi:hypothetical protein
MFPRSDREAYKKTIEIRPGTPFKAYADEFRVWADQQFPKVPSAPFTFFCDKSTPRAVFDDEIFSATTDIFVGPVAVQFSVPDTHIKLNWMMSDVGRRVLENCVRSDLAVNFRFFLPGTFQLQNRDGRPLSDLTEYDDIKFVVGDPLVHGTVVKPNGERIPFVTSGEPDSVCQVDIARHSLRTDGSAPADLKVKFKRSSGFIYDLKIKKPSPVVYAIEQLPDAHLPIRFDAPIDRAYLGHFLKILMHWFGDGGRSLPEVEISEPEVSQWRFKRWFRDEVPVFPVRVAGSVTTFVLPTGREVSAVLTAANEQTAELFAKEYLRTQCGYDGAVSVVREGDLRFRMQLQSPLPSMAGDTAEALSIMFSFGQETTSFR